MCADAHAREALVEHILQGYCEGFAGIWGHMGMQGHFGWCLQLVAICGSNQGLHQPLMSRLEDLLLVHGPQGTLNAMLVSPLNDGHVDRERERKRGGWTV